MLPLEAMPLYFFLHCVQKENINIYLYLDIDDIDDANKFACLKPKEEEEKEEGGKYNEASLVVVVSAGSCVGHFLFRCPTHTFHTEAVRMPLLLERLRMAGREGELWFDYINKGARLDFNMSVNEGSYRNYIVTNKTTVSTPFVISPNAI